MRELTPYEAAFYANDGYVTDQIVLSTVLYLSSKGYTRIILSEGSGVANYKIRKIKDYRSSDSILSESFNHIFEEDSCISLRELKEKGFGKIVKELRRDIEIRYNRSVDPEKRRLRSNMSSLGSTLALTATALAATSVLSSNDPLLALSVSVFLLGLCIMKRSEAVEVFAYEYIENTLNAKNFRKYVKESFESDDFFDLLPFAYAFGIHERFIKSRGIPDVQGAYIEGVDHCNPEDLISFCRELSDLAES